MEPDDALTDHMDPLITVGPPAVVVCVVTSVPRARYVIRQGVKPHVNHLLRISRDGYPPAMRALHAPRDAEVFQPRIDEGKHLSLARCRLDTETISGDQLNQGLLVAAQTEEPVTFLHRFGDCAVFDTSTIRVELLRRIELLTTNAVQSGVALLIEVILSRAGRPQLLYPRTMTGIRAGFDEIVKRHIKGPTQAKKAFSDTLHILTGADPLSLGALHVLQGIVIRSRLKPDFIISLPTMTRQDVGLDQFKPMTDVRFAVDIRNSRHNVVSRHQMETPLSIGHRTSSRTRLVRLLAGVMSIASETRAADEVGALPSAISVRQLPLRKGTVFASPGWPSTTPSNARPTRKKGSAAPMSRTLIRELPNRIGGTASVYGFVNTLRLQARIQFVLIRDHTGMVQVTHKFGADPDEIKKAFETLPPSQRSRSPADSWPTRS